LSERLSKELEDAFNQMPQLMNVLLIAVTTTEAPRVPEDDRAFVTPIADVIRVELRYDFMEQPNVPEGLKLAAARGKIVRSIPPKRLLHRA